jgi:AsmA protein
MRFLKPALLSVFVAAVLVIAALVYLAATFDPRAYEPQLADIVKERTGRTLTIEGDLDLSLWPGPALSIEGLALSERESAAPFVKIESLRVLLRLGPLLERRLVADEIVVHGAHIAIVRFEDGRLNVDDLLGGETAHAVAFELGGLKIERSTMSYRDLAAGRGFELAAIEIATGRLADGLSTPASVAFTFHDHARAIELALAAQGHATLDLAQRRLSFERAAFEAKGRLGRMDSIAARAAGRADLDSAGAKIALASASADVRTRMGDNPLDAAVEFQSLGWVEGTMRAGGVSARITTTHPAGRLTAALRVPGLEYSKGILRGSEMVASLDARHGEHRIRADVRSPLRADLAARQLVLPELKLGLALTGAQVPAAGLKAHATGTASVELARETVRLGLVGVVDGSRAKLHLSAVGFAAPFYKFAADIDRLDLGRYAGRTPTQGAQADAFDLAPLTGLRASGTVRVGELVAGDLRARNVTLSLK